VLGGDVVSGETAYPRWSCFWVPRGERHDVRAGAGGADVLALQFPKHET
jgi:hypothetical protein